MMVDEVHGASADADRATHERSQSPLSPPPVSVPSAGFTPGPWTVTNDSDSIQFFAIRLADNRALQYFTELNDQPLEANVRLMGAAPELYEAVAAMIRWDDAEKNARPFDEDKGAGFYDRMDLCAEAFAKARAALAKANGAAQ